MEGLITSIDMLQYLYHHHKTRKQPSKRGAKTKNNQQRAKRLPKNISQKRERLATLLSVQDENGENMSWRDLNVRNHGIFLQIHQLPNIYASFENHNCTFYFLTTMTSKNNPNSTGALLWQKQQKCNAEFFALTYGALVAELVRDYSNPAQIQSELDSMGHSIGVRCVEEVLAKADCRVSDFQSTQQVVGLAWKLFFGSNMDITQVSDNRYLCKISENPLETFVELPTDFQYSILYAGWVRGMLEMLQFDVSVTLSDRTANEWTVELQQILQEGAGEEYHEE